MYALEADTQSFALAGELIYYNTLLRRGTVAYMIGDAVKYKKGRDMMDKTPIDIILYYLGTDIYMSTMYNYNPCTVLQVALLIQTTEHGINLLNFSEILDRMLIERR